MKYRGIIIGESLQDKSLLSASKIISNKIVDGGTPDEWNMYKIEVSEDDIQSFVETISLYLQPDRPWYTHFYHEDPKNNSLIAVFSKKIIHAGKKDQDLIPAIEYGQKIGIPTQQLDFKPRNISDETW